mmetsp:Transcript_33280/g.91752  ORF Transcript_33280/g.91752 Transcript_33280/m.91752 type:complete len:204 (-) Transcript_33280:465-1076(-)
MCFSGGDDRVELFVYLQLIYGILLGHLLVKEGVLGDRLAWFPLVVLREQGVHAGWVDDCVEGHKCRPEFRPKGFHLRLRQQLFGDGDAGLQLAAAFCGPLAVERHGRDVVTLLQYLDVDEAPELLGTAIERHRKDRHEDELAAKFFAQDVEGDPIQASLPWRHRNDMSLAQVWLQLRKHGDIREGRQRHEEHVALGDDVRGIV